MKKTRKVTKQKWFEVGDEKREIYKEKINDEVKYYYLDSEGKQYIDNRDFKKAYMEKNYTYGAAKVFDTASKNSQKKKNGKSVIKCNAQDDESGRAKREKYIDDGLKLYILDNKNLIDYKEYDKTEQKKKVYREFYPGEELLVNKRDKLTKELNEFFGHRQKGKLVDTRKLKNKSERLTDKELTELISILRKYDVNELEDTTNNNAMKIEKYMRSQIRNKEYTIIVKLIAKYIRNKDEEEFKDNLNKYYENVDRQINGSLEIKGEKQPKRINKEKVLSQLAIMSTTELRELIEDTMHNSYNIDILINQLRRKKNSNESTIIREIKNHYKNPENVKLRKKSQMEIDQEKLLLKYIHEYVKGRYKKLLKYENLKDIDVKKDILKLDELEDKIINSVENKVIYYKINENKKPNEKNKDKVYNKEIRKLDETLKLKLINPLNKFIYLGLKHDKVQNKNIEKDADNLFNSGTIAEFEKRLLIKKKPTKLVKKLKNVSRQEDKTYTEISNQLKYIYILRNYLLHYQKFGMNGDIDELSSLKSNVYKDINRESIVKYEKKVLESNCVDTYLEVELVKEFIKEKPLVAVKSTYLPRFNKIYQVLYNQENNSELKNKTEDELQAIKYVWKQLYNTKFEVEINDCRYTEETVLEEFDSYTNFTNLGKLKEEIQRVYSTDEKKLRKYENAYIQFVAKSFNEWISKKSGFDMSKFSKKEKENSAENAYDEILGKKVEDFINNIEIDSQYLNSIISLAYYIDNNSLNHLINDMTKFKQYFEYLQNKYSEKELEAYFEQKNISDLTSESLTNTIEILKLILKINNINVAEMDIDVNNDTFDHGMSLMDIYNTNIPEGKEQYTEDTLVYQNGKDGGQQIIDTLNKENSIKFLINENKYGYLYKTLKSHIQYMEFYNKNYYNYLGRYSDYHTITKDGESKISECQYIKRVKYTETIDSKTEKNCNGRKIFEYDSELLKEYKELYKEVQDYDFLDNMIYLKSITKALKLQNDMYTRLMSWMYIYEQDTKHYLGIKDLGIEADSKFDKEKLKTLYEKKLLEFSNIEQFRDSIMHMNYFQTESRDGEIKKDKNEPTLIELFAKFQTIEKYSTARSNDVKDVFVKILEKYNIEVDLKGKNLNELKFEDFKSKKHTKFKDIDLISNEELEYLLYFIGIKKSKEPQKLSNNVVIKNSK